MKLSWILKTLAALAATCLSPLALAACLTAEAEPNNTDRAANTGLCSGTGVTGSISSTSDYDWFKLNVTGPGVIDISLAHGAGIDLDWYLYGATGGYLTYRSSTSNPETGSYTVSAAGTYYVRVKSYSGTGPYTLTVKFPGDTGQPPPPPPPTSVVTGKVWLNGGAIAQDNTAVFVSGLRQATGKKYHHAQHQQPDQLRQQLDNNRVPTRGHHHGRSGESGRRC